MPDLGEFEALANPRRRLCPIARALGELSAKEAAGLRAALERSQMDINAEAISRWLRARGFNVGYGFVRSHRNGQCTCADELEAA